MILPVKIRARLGAEEIRAVMQSRTQRWRPRRWMYYAATVLVIGLWAWMLATDQVGAAIDHELDRMPTAESVVMDGGMVIEDEPETLTMTATAYSWGCGNGDGYTASMTPIREGVIAVDPAVIPLGSQVEIVGMGVFSAEDTGSAIRGNRVDVFMSSRGAALDFGRQEVEVIIK